MNAQRYSKFHAILISSLVFFSMLGTSAMTPFVPSGSQAKPAATDKLLQFSSGGHVLGFTSQGMYTANGTHALHVDFMNANHIQPQSDSANSATGKTAPLNQVTYADLWDGVTLTYTAFPGDIYTTTYTLAPKADAQNIRLHYNAPLTFNKDGTLGIAFGSSRMTESAPVAWQMIHGSRVPVGVSFNVHGQEVSFTLGSYDPRYALTIDPNLVWNTLLGDSGFDAGRDIAVDGSGNIYVAGTSSGTWGCSPTPCTVRAYSGGVSDAWAAKLDSSGNLLWNTFLGGTGDEEYYDLASIAVDGSGNVYVAGQSTAAWGCSPVSCTVRAYTESPNNVFADAFAAKLNSSGSLLWNTFLGGSGDDIGGRIAVDSSGNIYVTGASLTGWSCSPAPCTVRANTGYYNLFVAKLDSSGNLIWNTFLGDDITSGGIALDGSGNIYVSGDSTAAWGCSPVPCTVRPHAEGSTAFVAKLDSSGNLIWNTFMGSVSGFGLAVDSGGNVYMVGNSYWTGWGSPVRPFSNDDTFVAKLDSSGNLIWNTFLGGSGSDSGNDISVDGSGNVYVAGTSNVGWGCSPDPCTVTPYTPNAGTYVAKLSSSGVLVWNTFPGVSWNEGGFSIALDGNRNIYITGESNAVWGSPVYIAHHTDAFVDKLDNSLTITGNVGASGVTLGYMDGTVKAVTSTYDGSYFLSVSNNWSGAITPSHVCYTFNTVNLSYGNVLTDLTGQDYTPAIKPGCANIDVSIAGNHQGTYGLPSAGSVRQNYTGVDSGPVKVMSTNSVNIIAAERDAWAANGLTTSFAQLMGLSSSQLSDTYVFPAYNNVTLNEQLRIANVSGIPTSVTVTIGGVLRGIYPLARNEAVRVNYAGLDSGPVIVQSTPGLQIIAAERDAWTANGTTTSFVQLMGLPAGQVSDTYLFPAYNNVTLNEQLRIGNVDSVPSTVTVTIGGVLRGTYPLAANEAVRVNYAGLDSGPVIVQGTHGVHIIAAERDAWAAMAPYNTTTSFAQLMGLPAGQLSDTYEFPAYNNVTLNEQLRIGNVDSVPTTVTVTIGGVLQGTYPLAANEAVRVNYAGLDSGPVVIQGTSGVHIIAAERDAWTANGVITSFTQLMGLPAGSLSDIYLFPAYNNVTLNEQLRFGVP